MPLGAARTLWTRPGLVTDGLVLHLDAANSDSYAGSGTTWSDISGNGYDFTLTSMTFTGSAGDDQAYFAPGPSQGWADASASLTGTMLRLAGRTDQPFTYEVWQSVTDVYDGCIAYSNGFAGAGKGIDMTLMYNSGTYRGRVTAEPRPSGVKSKSNEQTFATSDAVMHQWVIAGQCDGSTITFYVDGEANGTFTSNNTGFTTGESDDKPRIGRNAESNGRFKNGTRYQRCAVYNRVLSAAEVKRNFIEMRRRWWRGSYDAGNWEHTQSTSSQWGDAVTDGKNIGVQFKTMWRGSVGSVKVNVTIVSANMTDCVARIYTDNSGSPGTQVGTDSDSVSITTTGDKTFTFSTPVPLDPGTKYWLVFSDETTTGYVYFGITYEYDTTTDKAYESGGSDTITSISHGSNNRPSSDKGYSWRAQINIS